ncbi:MAG: hypothetical protein ACI4TI_02385 [Christensenellales bacterium]
MKSGLKLIKLFIFYVLSSVSSIIIWNLNANLISNSSADAMTQLGLGLSKVILIPLYIILYLVAITMGLSSFFTSIKLIQADSKAIKVISIIMLLLSLALIGFVIYVLIQTINLF